MITTCSKCSKLYESGSEEQAYEPDRLCFDCVKQLKEQVKITVNLNLGCQIDTNGGPEPELGSPSWRFTQPIKTYK